MSTAWRITLLIIVALAIPIVPFAITGELPGDRWLSANDDHAMVFAAVGIGLLTADVVLPVPSSIVGSLLGARLGMSLGFVAAWTGLMAGNLAGYALGRATLSQLNARLPALPTQLVLLASRPVPVLAEALCFAAGAGGMTLRSFALSCAVGNAVYALVLAGNGAAYLPGALLGPGLVIPMGLPVAGWLLWRALHRWRDRRSSEHAIGDHSSSRSSGRR